MNRGEYITPSVFILCSIIVGYYFIHVSVTRENLTVLEGTLLQLFTLTSGLIGSYLVGKRLTEKSTSSRLKSYGKSALRRIWTLYLSLSQVAELIADEASPLDPPAKLYTIRELITTQLVTADAALEDWKDILPDWQPTSPQNLEDRYNGTSVSGVEDL